jgi:hypothetical protein
MGHKRGSSSASLAHAYTPFGRFQRLLERGQQIFKVELQFEFGDAIFLFDLVYYINFTVSRSGELLPRTPARTFHVATPLSLRRSYRRVPTSGVRISRFLPACVRREQAQHVSCPSRTGGGVFGRCRCAPRPDAFGWALAQPRRSLLLARHRTARDSLNGIRRAWAALMLSRHELCRRAFVPACTFGLRCRGLWRCVVVVSSRASESVVV